MLTFSSADTIVWLHLLLTKDHLHTGAAYTDGTNTFSLFSEKEHNGNRSFLTNGEFKDMTGHFWIHFLVITKDHL